MARIRITEEDIEALEAKADVAYDTLKKALAADNTNRRAAIISTAECLYQHDLGCLLQMLTMKATHSFRRLRKGGKRAEKIEKYILQYTLMANPLSDEHGNYKMRIIGNPDDGMGGLRAFLDATDDRSSEEGEVFRQLQHKASALRKESRYDCILKALDYIREKYKPPAN